jgi:signal transduction histidine kinase
MPSKKKATQKRIQEFLSVEEIPETTPSNAPAHSAGGEASELRKAILNAARASEKGKDSQEKISWEEFLNAIDRDEKIGFVFDQEKVIPSDEQLDEEAVTADALLKIGDEVFGKIQLEGSEDLSEEDARVLSSVAQQVAQHIENLRLIEQANQYRAEAEEASRHLIQQGWEEYLQTPDAPALGYLYDQKRVVATNDLETISNPTDAEVITQEIAIRDEPIGKLTLADIEEQSEQTQALLATVVDGLSAHIENLRLLDETERSRQQLDKRAAELETVAKVSTAASAIRDPESLLRSVVDLTNYSFKLYHTSVYLLDEDENGSAILKLAAASGKIGHKMLDEGHFVKFNEKQSVYSKLAQAHDVYISDNTQDNPIFLAHSYLPDTRSEMVIPMIVADQFIGIFDVKSEVQNRFTEDDIRTYTTLASQTAVALQNAQLYEEQIQTVERLRELDHLKSAFLANMSHELRTPLNSISGFTQVMLEGLDGPLTPEMEEDLGLISKNAKHLLLLINEVLDMAKIEAGRLSVTLGPANLYQAINEVVKTTGTLARENNLTMTLENNLPEDLIVMADDMRIQQVMINLIGNAMKFTKEGGVTIRADVVDEQIVIRVSDTGIGIPPHQLEVIFEAFSQVDTSTTRKTGGTGLGLPISRRFVEMHNGRLWAESSGIPGEGSTFIIELPIVYPENEKNT